MLPKDKKKVALSLVNASRKLRQYFISHINVVCTDLPLKQRLHWPYLVKILTKCSIKMYEFNVSFEPMKAPNPQMFTYFIAKMTLGTSKPTHIRILFTKSSSNSRGSRVGLILENEYGLVIGVSLCFKLSTTNHQDKYEAFFVDLKFVTEMGP